MFYLLLFRWLGIHDKAKEGKWVYQSSNLPINFSDWVANEPNNHKDSNEDCVEHWRHRGSGWNDITCNSERPFVCEY